jgi:phage N-6-adenine-methyltransferase
MAGLTELGKGNNEWYTPSNYIDLARTTMGSIDVDPASNDFAQETVRAGTYFTAESNGLDKDWTGNVWLNPPYSRGLIRPFVDKLIKEVENGNAEQAILLVNNCADTAWFQDAAQAASAICFPRGRIRFYMPNGKLHATPPLGQAFLYFGHHAANFARHFGPHGLVAILDRGFAG